MCPKLRSIIRPFAVLLFVLVAASLALSALNGFQALEEHSKQWQLWELQVFIVFLLLSLALAALSLRHWQEARHETARRKQAEARLAQERQLLRALINSSSDHIFVKDTQGCFIVSNAAHARAIGQLSPAELVGKTVYAVFPPDMAAQFEAEDQAVIASNQALIELERYMTDADGHQWWGLTAKAPLHDSSGKVIGIAGISRDITPYKQAIEALRESESKLRAVVEHTSDVIFIKDVEGRYVLANPAAAHLIGKDSPEDVIGKTDWDLFDSAESRKSRELDQQVMATRKLHTYERSRILNGVMRHLQTTKFPYQPQGGEPAGVVGISRDMTLLKEAEQRRLELAREKERVQIMANFMQDAAHDFRTPLAIINSSLYLLQKASDPARKEEYAHKIEQQVKHLEKVLNGLTKLVQLDTVSKLSLSPVKLNMLVQNAYVMILAQANAKHLTLVLDLDESLLPVPASESDLHHALLELAYNAVTYTPEGGTVRLSTSQENGCAVLAIQDTGSGIAEADLPLIFKRFYRTDKARSTETGGVGLGLSIVQKIIEMHNGSISVASTLGAGTTFTIRLPMA